MTTPRVALLGTGIMGRGMARNIVAAGIPLTVWNRTRGKAEGLGAEVAETPGEAVRGASVLVTILADGAATEKAVRDASPAAGTVWLQQATVGIDGCARLADLADELGLVYVDAPVLGTKGPAEAGQLTVLASGPDEAREAVTPVLDAVGAKTLWLGAAGNGSRLKLVANSWVLTVVEGVAEALTLSTALGLDPQSFLDVIKGSATDSPYVQLKGAAMLGGELEAQFPLWGAAKDARLIEEAATEAGVELALIAGARRHFERAEAEGHGDLDMAATYLSH
ncbi:MAG: NAD(P)-dependent oxidoreductase [Propionibacteriales bacterium]|nr:NAD(P)-dependent oxidoreductase [Propionibacteriales bacterium]